MMKNKSLVILIISVCAITQVMLLPGCDQLTGNLTREKAIDLLNQHLSSGQAQQMSFQNKESFQQAIKDGFVDSNTQDTNNCYSGYIFTSKGMDAVGEFIGNNCIDPFGFKFNLRKPIPERVDEILGISEGHEPGTKYVDFTTKYIFPTEMNQLAKYIYTGRKEQRIFKKYDDGWRVD